MADMPEVWSQPAAPSLPNYPFIEIAKIKSSRYQARKNMDDGQIKALAESIRQEGLLEPIIVRPMGTGYELVSGERRLRACQLLGFATIEAKVIQTISEAEAAAKGLIENLQREDLNPIEEAEGFRALLDLADSHWTQARISEVTGKRQSHISEAMGVLKLPKEVVEVIRQRIITLEHGVELLRLNNANSQKGMANKIVKEGWSVKQTREAIDRKLGKQRVPRTEGRGPGKGPEGQTQFAGPASPPAEPDRLAPFWAGVTKQSLGGTPTLWQVDYKGSYTWEFGVNVQNLTAYREGSGDNVDRALRLCLADWFDKMAAACRQ